MIPRITTWASDMKDALGHGSGSRGGSQFVKPNGRSIIPSRPAGAKPNVGTANMAHVADLRNRLSSPKQGLLQSFARGLKDALDAGARLHANSFAPTSRN